MTDLSHTSGRTPAARYLKDYVAPDYQIEKIDLYFDLEETSTTVRSVLKVRKNPHAQSNAPLKLDGSQLELKQIAINGQQLQAAEYHLLEEQLVIASVPEQFELEIINTINPQENTALEGLYVSSSMFCTQCEAEGFRRITYFPDRPDVMSRYTVTITADKKKYPILLSNGNLQGTGILENGRHWARWDDPSLKPSYLFALVAGDLQCKEDTFITMNGRKVSLKLYTETENIHKCDHALLSLKQAMKWDEDTYGREYDLDIYMIVAVNDFNMGAMENKGLNVFNSACVLASPETATDDDFYRIQSIIGHEYFHNWSGNRVTCRDWFQLSLKEGFTVFRDEEFSADLNSRAVKRIDDVNVLRSYQFAEDAGPMAHPVRPDHYIEISNFYTVTIYNKGAEVVRMLRNLLGWEGFRKGTDLYFERHDGQAVTTDDFVKALEDANAVDFSQFKNWYRQAGTPVLDISENYNAEQQVYTLTITQSCPTVPVSASAQIKNRPFHIPVTVALLDHQGNEMPVQLESSSLANVKEYTLSVTQQKESFNFINVTSKPTVSLGRGFSAPVKINAPYTNETLAFLFAHDTDEFNRWDAGQKLAINIMLDLVRCYESGETLVMDQALVHAFSKTLSNTKLDQALVAQALTLPSESYLADQCKIVNVDAIHAVRQFLRQQLALALQQKWLETYTRNNVTKKYSFNAADMAQRALKNLCLSYLMEIDTAEVHAICANQFTQADNMTDAMAALSILSHYDIPERTQAIQQFYTKWKADKLVVDKWFSIQAMSRLPATIRTVNELMRHPAFSIKNPNNVRAVIGRFCAGNPVQFHAADGGGYALLTDIVLQLDSLNPQIAARLLQIMSRWRRYDEHRQNLMREQLQRVVNKAGLSKDVYEIASKCLE
ncbi:MAG: aminopeptidase N [Gammaproteobacteria bacterium]|nr:aminopeptidase N [Gammaproteobacteria bacterium]